MTIRNILVGRSILLSDDSLHILEALDDFFPPFSLDLHGLQVFSRGVLVGEDNVLRFPHSLDVVVDSLETFESLEKVVALPSVVKMRVGTPLD